MVVYRCHSLVMKLFQNYLLCSLLAMKWDNCRDRLNIWPNRNPILSMRLRFSCGRLSWDNLCCWILQLSFLPHLCKNKHYLQFKAVLDNFKYLATKMSTYKTEKIDSDNTFNSFKVREGYAFILTIFEVTRNLRVDSHN